MIDLLQEQIKAKRLGKRYALATVVKTQGSTPRGVGCKMMIFEDGSFCGTVGGGAIEKMVLSDAVNCIKSGECALNEYENDGGLGPNCGGVASIYIDVEQETVRLVVCGAGHVGAAVIKAAAMLNYNITVVDTRTLEEIGENANLASRVIQVDDFKKGVEELEIGAGAYYLVSTYGHAQDAEALAGALSKDAAYIGMMGSPGKIKAVMQKQREYGFSEDQLEKVYTPVGLDIGGSTPAEISISIISEMQMVRYGGTAKPMRDV